MEEEILTYEERTGKGGHHRVYFPNMNKDEFSAYVIRSINEKLESVFPQSKELKARVIA